MKMKASTSVKRDARRPDKKSDTGEDLREVQFILPTLDTLAYDNLIKAQGGGRYNIFSIHQRPYAAFLRGCIASGRLHYVHTHPDVGGLGSHNFRFKFMSSEDTISKSDVKTAGVYFIVPPALIPGRSTES
ncbi:hypothetical protein KM043_010094 [Ampulex compressa]|nr:hypothetical protein KM043_010094 [Ampulex compressa]